MHATRMYKHCSEIIASQIYWTTFAIRLQWNTQATSTIREWPHSLHYICVQILWMYSLKIVSKPNIVWSIATQLYAYSNQRSLHCHRSGRFNVVLLLHRNHNYNFNMLNIKWINEKCTMAKSRADLVSQNGRHTIF